MYPELKIYNTLSRKKERFVPLYEDPTYEGPKKDFIGIYSCGPTVYFPPHIGNLRATFTADLLRNTLKLFGYKVLSVMNITDVGHLVSDGNQGEDKLEKGARREGISVWEIAKKYENLFRENLLELNIDMFDVMPRATEHIKEQIQMIQSLEKRGYTYTVEDDGIYMDTSKIEDYGALMGANYKKRLQDLHAGERVEMKGKRNATDFALWKFSLGTQQRQMERESPWGIGFPGWHIECSAMASEYLGKQFDIHHGGSDHITIHHPNEIAQSECAFSVHPWVKYWVHNEFLKVDGGKMSKSLGNIYSLEDIKERGYSPIDLRFFYFGAQYGSFQNFTREGLLAAKSARNNLKNKIKKHQKSDFFTVFGSLQKMDIKELKNHFKTSAQAALFLEKILEALGDNINTPNLLSLINAKGFENEDTLAIVYWLDFYFLKCELFLQDEMIAIPEEIRELAEKRKQAKEDKDYILADQIREAIVDAGWSIKDTQDSFELIPIK